MLSLRIFILFLSFHCLSPICAQDSPAPATRNAVGREAKIESLGWLQGHWRGDEDGTVTDEYWMPPGGGMMPGVNRSVTRSGKASFEFMRIAESDDGLTLFASPQGREATPFPMTDFSGSHVIFESGANDFPNKIIYRMRGEILHARVEGLIDGKELSMEWNWKAIKTH